LLVGLLIVYFIAIIKCLESRQYLNVCTNKNTTNGISHPSEVMLTISSPFCFGAAIAEADTLSDFVASTLESCRTDTQLRQYITVFFPIPNVDVFLITWLNVLFFSQNPCGKIRY